MFLVGIAGGSGSGKTTFANKILQRVTDPGVALLHQDSYYLPSLPEGANFDHPDAFDWPLLRNHLEALKQGLTVQVPVYDYRTNRRTLQTQPVGPSKVIVLEGIFTLWDPPLRSLFDLKIYLHVEADIRFIRRLHRDVRERGRSLDGIIRQYYDTVRPMHHEYLEPTRQYADISVGEETDVAAEVIAARILSATSGAPVE
ncbi:MAG: uridine kinase [Oligoflexia bacterium]|jgi:uridine kinase